AGKILGGGQGKDGGGGEAALHLQAVQEDQHHRVDPQQAENSHHDGEDVVVQTFCFSHQDCTSLERVKRSCTSEITTTIRKKTTALAWPMPFHWAPLRP